MRFDFSTAIAVLFAAILAVVLVWGADLIGGPDSLRILDALSVEHLGVLLAATDHAVTMLTTLALGLVVLVGFGLKLAEGRGSLITIWDRLAGVGFVFALFASVFFGFGTRRLAFLLVYSEHHDWETVEEAINKQAVLLMVAAAFGFYLFARSLGRIRPVDVDGGALQSSSPPIAPGRHVPRRRKSRPPVPAPIEKQPEAVGAKRKRKEEARNA